MSACSGMYRRVAGLALAAIVISPRVANAQDTFDFYPSMSISEVHESNLFSTATNRLQDFITRVTPAAETRYHSPLWTFSGRYALDVERFVQHPELSSAASRQHGTIALDYRPTPRVTITSGAEYLTTRTPAELIAATGLTFTRARARRTAARTTIARELNPVTAGTLEYAFTRDRLGLGFGSDSHAGTASVVRRASSRTTLTGRYRVNHFDFTRRDAARAVIMSHSVAVGISRALSPHVTLLVEAGPRLTGDVVRPELTASIDWTREPLSVFVGYSRTQTTAIGLVEPLDTQSLQVSVARTLWRSLEVRITPGAYQSVMDGLRADVFVLGAAIAQHFSKAFALELQFDGAVQRGGLLATTAEQIVPRHSVVLRFVAREPERQAPRW